MQLIYSRTQLHVKCQAEKLEGKNGGVDALNKWTTEEALFFVDKNCEIKQKKCWKADVWFASMGDTNFNPNPKHYYALLLFGMRCVIMRLQMKCIHINTLAYK